MNYDRDIIASGYIQIYNDIAPIVDSWIYKNNIRTGVDDDYRQEAQIKIWEILESQRLWVGSGNARSYIVRGVINRLRDYRRYRSARCRALDSHIQASDDVLDNYLRNTSGHMI